jgi:hypothetical protein
MNACIASCDRPEVVVVFMRSRLALSKLNHLLVFTRFLFAKGNSGPRFRATLEWGLLVSLYKKAVDSRVACKYVCCNTISDRANWLPACRGKVTSDRLVDT